YPPGSTYKPFMALAGLALNKRTPEFGFHDPGFYTFGGHTFRNDVPQGQGWIDMNRAIMVSNDTYFYMLAHDLGVNAIANFMAPWGFGQITGIDIAGEARGILPSTDWKKKTYRKPEQQRWYEGETISLGIGQGYNSFTMLQLAHATATLADDGVVMKPHLVKEIENPITHQTRLTVPHESGRIPLVTQGEIDFVKNAMVQVTSNPSGTAYQVFRGVPYEVAGKTGTAQVFSLQGQKYHGGALAEHLRDHSLFTAFAPADHPQIAVAVIVENGGWGASVAGPIVRRVLDYYLLDRNKPGVLAAEVAAAAASSASAAQDTPGPVIGTSEPQQSDTLLPVAVAPGFKALPLPVLPASAPAASSRGAAAVPASGLISAFAASATSSAASSAASASAAAEGSAVTNNGVARSIHSERPDARENRDSQSSGASGATPNAPVSPGTDDQRKGQ
ncbi:MAG: penicillin-binding protein 2, partial [Paraburkholderia sp.]|nr:penicillin-binding protein 2 [Paraburkholderia sp.]